MYKYSTAETAPSEQPHLRLIRDEGAPLYDGHPPAKRKRHTGRFGMVPEEVRALKDLAAIGVFTILSFHFNDQGECWPSNEAIAADLGISPRSVIRAMKKLVAAKIIEVVPRFDANGAQRSNKYRLTVTPPVTQSLPPDRNDTGGVTHVHTELEPIELDEKELLRSSKKKPSKIAPYDFQPTEDMIAWAEEQGFSRPMIERETQKFRNKEFKRPYTDWEKVWKNWFLADWVKPDAKPKRLPNGLAGNFV